MCHAPPNGWWPKRTESVGDHRLLHHPNSPPAPAFARRYEAICGVTCTELVLDLSAATPPPKNGLFPCSSPRFDALGTRFDGELGHHPS